MQLITSRDGFEPKCSWHHSGCCELSAFIFRDLSAHAFSLFQVLLWRCPILQPLGQVKKKSRQMAKELPYWTWVPPQMLPTIPKLTGPTKSMENRTKKPLPMVTVTWVCISYFEVANVLLTILALPAYQAEFALWWFFFFFAIFKNCANIYIT